MTPLQKKKIDYLLGVVEASKRIGCANQCKYPNFSGLNLVMRKLKAELNDIDHDTTPLQKKVLLTYLRMIRQVAYNHLSGRLNEIYICIVGIRNKMRFELRFLYHRLALITCYLLDIDLALFNPFLLWEVKLNKSWNTFFAITVLFYVHDIIQPFATFQYQLH